MGLLESPINTNKPYQWISTQGEKLFGLVEICCKHTLLNAQMACLFFFFLACLKMSFTENDVADLTGSLLSPPPLWIYPPLGAVLVSPFMHKPCQVLSNSLNWLLLYRIPGGSILFSGVKQIQNKLVRSFSYFTSSRKKEVCGRFNIKGTAVVVFF